MKKTLLFIMALLVVGGVKAKTFETSLWTGSHAAGTSSYVTLSTAQVAAMKAGDAVRVYITNTSGASYAIWYGNTDFESGSALSAHDNKYGWVNGGSAYEDVVLTSADITNLSGNSIYIKIQTSTNSTLTKVSHFGEVTL